MAETMDLAFTVTTDSLPAKVSEVIRAAAIEKLQDVPRLRQYGMTVTMPDKGAMNYYYYMYSDVGDADEVSEAADFVYDDADATQGSVAVKKYGKGFKISWEADNLNKLQLRAAQSKQCISKVLLKEDELIITRLIADTNNTYAATQGAWSVSTADPVQNIRRAVRLMKNDGYDADAIMLNPTNAEELMSFVAQNLFYGLTEKTVTAGILPKFMGLDIIQSNSVTEGTAIVLKTGSSGAFEVGEAMKLGLNIFDDNDAQVVKVQAYERIGVAVVRPDAICTITSI